MIAFIFSVGVIYFIIEKIRDDKHKIYLPNTDYITAIGNYLDYINNIKDPALKIINITELRVNQQRQQKENKQQQQYISDK